MKQLRPALLAAALAAAFPAFAQSNAEILQELKALRDKVNELEAKLKAAEAAKPKEAKEAQWGMTPEQAAEFNRIAVKTESLQDSFTDQGFKGLVISGMLDPTFIWTKTRGGSFAFLNGFSGNGGDLSYPDDMFAYDNSYFGQAMLDIQKETEDGTRWRLTLAPQKNASSGYNIGSIIHEASVSLELTDNQTRLWVGQIPDWSGYEYIWAHQQPLITHNLLFDFSIPSFYTGAALDITRGKWWTRVFVGNMNASRYDRDNQAPVLAYRVDYSKGEFDGFGFAGVHGKSFGSRIDLFEVDGYYVRGDWTLQGQLGWGRIEGAAANGGDASWTGLSGLVGYAITPRLKAIARADYVKNDKNGGGMFGSVPSCADEDCTTLIVDGRNGFGPEMSFDETSAAWVADASGKGNNRYALSLGMQYLYGLNTSFKVEYRLDGASGNAFIGQNGNYRKTNHLLGTSVVVTF
jgi:Putative beta-barrel porin-2, OmpL-like. bbp2